MTHPDGLRIRPIVERDLDAVIAIERESDSAPHWDISSYLALFQSDTFSPFKRHAMVVEVAIELAGFAIFRIVAAEAELESIVVTRGYQRRGLGMLLLSKSVREAKELGAARFDLEVRESNAAAIRLYRAAGFQETGRRRAYYRDPEEDAVLMGVIL
jgi:ribosomal-protein-alanine N-acetyltransferase